MAFQDQYGFWNSNASYHSEVHISDLLLSFIGNLFCTFGYIIIISVPCTDGKGQPKKNNMTWQSMIPNTISIIVLLIFSFSMMNIDNTCQLAGMIKAILSLVAYFPQFY